MTQRAIGFDRHINVEWLDATAAMVGTGAGTKEVQEQLRKRLEGVLASGTPRSALGKTITVLTHIWCEVPESVVPLRGRALTLMPSASAFERVALHWSMALATYAFFGDVATAVGRMLSLQGDVSLNTLTRRMTETWGDRSTMPPAARKVVRSMVRWGTLRDSEKRGVYLPLSKRLEIGPDCSELLLEALLLNGSQRAIAVVDLAPHPAIFPFCFEISLHRLRQASQFQVHRQGVDMEIVELSSR